MATKHSRRVALAEPLIVDTEDWVARGEYAPIREIGRTASRRPIERDAAKVFDGIANPVDAEVVRERA